MPASWPLSDDAPVVVVRRGPRLVRPIVLGLEVADEPLAAHGEADEVLGLGCPLLAIRYTLCYISHFATFTR